MSDNPLYVTLTEYLDILKDATIAAYFTDSDNKNMLWHPEDISNNIGVVNEVIGVALGKLTISRRECG